MSVAVVILNWNGKHFLEQFVPVLLEKTRVAKQKSALGSTSDYPDTASIFVADNGSTDGSIEWLDWAYPQHEVRVIRFDKNLGFTGGYNKAFQIINDEGGKFKYYLLLNSDVEVTEGWLGRLTDFMDKNPKVGVCSPKVLWHDHKDTFEHAGACGGMMDRYYFPYCRGRVLSKVEKDMGQYDTPCEVFWASGTSFMVRSKIWNQLGGLDESFFAHMEEIDFCWRAKLLGWQVWVVPDSYVFHVGGGTLPNNSPRKLYLNFRNNLLMMYKNIPISSRARIIFMRMCIDRIIGCIYLITGKWSFFKSVISAHSDYRKMKHTMVLPKVTQEVPRPKKYLYKLAMGK